MYLARPHHSKRSLITPTSFPAAVTVTNTPDSPQPLCAAESTLFSRTALLSDLATSMRNGPARNWHDEVLPGVDVRPCGAPDGADDAPGVLDCGDTPQPDFRDAVGTSYLTYVEGVSLEVRTALFADPTEPPQGERAASATP